MIKLYDHPLSGNAYKVRLLLSHLEIPHELEFVDVLGDRDQQRGAEFAARNPLLRIPTVVLEDGTALGESVAILHWFADGTPYLPDDRLGRARVLQWMGFEQNTHEPNIATARYMQSIVQKPPPSAIGRMWRAGGERALSIMDRYLAAHDFFVGDRYTIADMALFAYTHVADEAGFELEKWPATCAWLGRVRAQPGFVPMTWS